MYLDMEIVGLILCLFLVCIAYCCNLHNEIKDLKQKMIDMFASEAEETNILKGVVYGYEERHMELLDDYRNHKTSFDTYRDLNAEDIKAVRNRIKEVEDKLSEEHKEFMEMQTEEHKAQMKVYDGFASILDYDVSKAMKGGNRT